jgi:hypothetical protein
MRDGGCRNWPTTGWPGTPSSSTSPTTVPACRAASAGPATPACACRWSSTSREKWKHLAPTGYTAGAVSDRLVSFVDFAPTVLSLAGVATPATMQGRAFAGKYQVEGPLYLHGFRGRMDERYDLVRSVTDGRYVYLRNYWPHVSQGQRVRTQFQMPTTQVWRRLYDEGRTNEAQSIFWREPKAPEELYDLQSDPDEVRNLAAAPAHRATLERLRHEAQAHAVRIRDLGFLPEAEVHARAGPQAPRDALAADRHIRSPAWSPPLTPLRGWLPVPFRNCRRT